MVECLFPAGLHEEAAGRQRREGSAERAGKGRIHVVAEGDPDCKIEYYFDACDR